MIQLCLVAVTVALCILIISLFHPQIMEPLDDEVSVAKDKSPYIVGSRGYVDKPWHNAGGARYYFGGGRSIKHHQDVIDYRGHKEDTKFVSDVLAGNTGIVPLVPMFKTEEGFSNASTTQLEKKENFWYDMNRLEDAGWYSGKLDSELKDMLDQEKKWHKDLVRKNVKVRGWGRGTSRHDPGGLSASERKSFARLAKWEKETIPLVEGFGNNRAPSDWNEVDYPIVTSNGINMTPNFPQGA